METPDHIAAQRLLAGHPALDFVNSAAGEGGSDLLECLRSYEDLVAWAQHSGVISADIADWLIDRARSRPAEADRVLRRAVSVRGELDRLFRAKATGATPARAAVRTIAETDAEALVHAELAPHGGRFIWSWTDAHDLGVVLWPVAHAAAELATSDALGRVKVCAGCPWLFLDASKNHSRRWCAMDDGCGSAAKMKSYVARRAGRHAGTRK